MKTTSATWTVILFFSLLPHAFSADTKPDVVYPMGIIFFQSAEVAQVLEIYAQLSGAKLVTSSHVKKLSARITVKQEVELNRSEALKFIEKGLVEQAGVVITKVDDKRVSVTYNDALPLTIVTTSSPAQK